MASIRVYRVEHESNGLGPFQHSRSYNYIVGQSNGIEHFIRQGEEIAFINYHPLTHPSPFYEDKDTLRLASYNYKFACLSKEDLEYWFYEESVRNALCESGYVVVEYEIPHEKEPDEREDYYHIARSGVQLVFNPNTAKVVAKHKISDFF